MEKTVPFTVSVTSSNESRGMEVTPPENNPYFIGSLPATTSPLVLSLLRKFVKIVQQMR